MNIKAKAITAFAAVCTAATTIVQAKTVLWYHFDEHGNGYRPYHLPTRDDVIVNAADPGNLRGYAGGNVLRGCHHGAQCR